MTAQLAPRPRRRLARACAAGLLGCLLASAPGAQIATLPLLPDTGPDIFDQYGASLDAADGYVVVAAPYADLGAPAAGALRMFQRAGLGWSEQALLVAANPVSSAHLGEALAFDGQTLLASARGHAPAVVHSFERSEDGGVTAWLPGELLSAGGPANGFGWDVAVDGDRAAVGVYEELGRVFVYGRSDGEWQLESVLQPESLQPGDLFGSALALHGDTLVVGASHSHIGGGNGRVWVFRDDSDSDDWSVEAVLEPDTPPPHGGFGWALELDADLLVVGAFESEDAGALPGAAYVFRRSGQTWTQEAQLLAAADHAPASFGRAVGISGEVVAVGAFMEGVGPFETPAGRTFVFRKLGSTWAQVADLRPGGPQADDHFGRAVAVSGAVVAVGAPGQGLGGKAFAYAPLTKLGAWIDLGDALPGGAAPPKLAGQGSLVGGASMSLHLTGGPASAPAVLVLGSASLGLPFLGGVLHPQPDALLGLVLDGDGRLDVSWTWPRGLPTGTATVLQAWIVDPLAVAGWSASNGLTALTP